MKLNELDIEILEDGSLRITSERFSAAVHMTAERFLTEIASLAGGKVVVQKQGKAHTHSHDHAHDHAHE
jgi:hypothetical protein